MTHPAPRLAAAFGLAFVAALAHAQPSPAGLWRQVDDATQKDTSLVRVVESGGVLSAKVEKVIVPSTPDVRCVACDGDLRDKPVRGMTIIQSLRQREGDRNVYEGGEILDPDNGKFYKVRLTLSADGKTLAVRGYIGTPLIGRTQTWIRLE
jgi:uncharacterized protein (DUF2147 family)